MTGSQNNNNISSYAVQPALNSTGIPTLNGLLLLERMKEIKELTTFHSGSFKICTYRGPSGKEERNNNKNKYQ